MCLFARIWGGAQLTRVIPADVVVLVTPNQPLRALFEALSGTQQNLTLIGDARQPRDMLHATWEGHAAARAIG